MLNIEKFYANQAAVFSNIDETQLLFGFVHPRPDEKGSFEMQLSNEVIVIMTFESAKELHKALGENLRKHEKGLEEKTLQNINGQGDVQ